MNQLNNVLNNFKTIEQFDPKQYSYLKTCLGSVLKYEEYTIYAKVTEQKIEFTDNNDNFMYSTVISFSSFVIFRLDGTLFDTFIVPLKPFRIRNEYEIKVVDDLLTELTNELDNIRDFYITEDTNYGIA